jgi:hypothetical protein
LPNKTLFRDKIAIFDQQATRMFEVQEEAMKQFDQSIPELLRFQFKDGRKM